MPLDKSPAAAFLASFDIPPLGEWQGNYHHIPIWRVPTLPEESPTPNPQPRSHPQ